MLFAFRDVGGKKCGFFCVRKEWDVERGLWVLRLVLDRRPRNAQERAVRATDDAFPHGSCFLDIVLGSGEQLLLWISDLPSFYYTMMVTDKRARTNQFTDVLDEEPYADLRAVRELHEREEAAGGPDDACRRNGQVVFGLRCMAMGDRNACDFGQAAHREAGTSHTTQKHWLQCCVGSVANRCTTQFSRQCVKCCSAFCPFEPVIATSSSSSSSAAACGSGDGGANGFSSRHSTSSDSAAGASFGFLSWCFAASSSLLQVKSSTSAIYAGSFGTFRAAAALKKFAGLTLVS